MKQRVQRELSWLADWTGITALMWSIRYRMTAWYPVTPVPAPEPVSPQCAIMGCCEDPTACTYGAQRPVDGRTDSA